MPFSIRTRITLAISGLFVALLVIFAIATRAVQVDQASRDAEESVRAVAIRLGTRLVTASRVGGTRLVVTDADGTSPTPWLVAMLENEPNYVYVQDSAGRTLHTTREVDMLPAVQRATLDSVAADVQPGPRISAVFESPTGWRVTTSDPFFNRVQSVPLRSGTLLVYAVDVATGVSGVSRLVMARVMPPTQVRWEGLLAPMIILGPLIILAAVVAAHYAVGAAQQPIEQLINDVEATTDGRSLHRRLAMDEAAGDRVERLTETLNAMIARLETSFGSLRLFTADASHELKTPLTVLRADVERAMAPSTTPTERLEALEEALAETTRMADLVESLLTLSRADEGRFDLHREPVDLAGLAREVYETALLLGELRNVKVEMNRVEPLTVQGDRARLRQLWLNLVENAIKYTPEGGLVQLMLWRQDGSAQFVVRDSGIGIAAADLPHVFDRFWRADRARSRASERGGFGLGLAISQYIAHAHGGSLTAQSRMGRGSTFVVDLPLTTPAGDPTES